MQLLELSNTKTTTHQAEWWGWFGIVNWLVLMMYALSSFSLPSSSNVEVVENSYNLYFILVFACAIVVFSFCFGKNLDKLSNIAFYTTPIAVIITALFPLLPFNFGMALYLVSPILMAPTLVRRVFGVLYTAPKGKQLTSYISAFTISYICYSIWLTLDPPKEVAFLVPALLAISCLGNSPYHKTAECPHQKQL